MVKPLVSWILALTSVLAFAGSAGAVTSSELYRTAPLGFGKFEARIQFAAGDGVIGSFFLWKDGSEQASVYWNELDFEKLRDDCDLQTNSIFGLPQSGHEEAGYGLEGLCDGYHTYTYEWTPDYIAWLVDGVEIRRDTGADASAYADNAAGGMQVRFNLWPGDATFGGNFDAAILPVYEFVAWAQFSAYAPGAGDDGTDFELSWREEFDALPSGWSKGSWASPLGLSTHSAANVVFVDGIAVLALTADDATGFRGTPPPDEGSPGTGGGGGSGGAGDGTGGFTEATGGAATGGVAAGAGGATDATGGTATGDGGSAPGTGGSGASAAGGGGASAAGGTPGNAGGALPNGPGGPAVSTGGAAPSTAGSGCRYAPQPPAWSHFGVLWGLVLMAGAFARRSLRSQDESEARR